MITHTFEELIGSHSGVGGSQSKPVIIYSSSGIPEGKIIGAENIYKIIKNNLEIIENGV